MRLRRSSSGKLLGSDLTYLETVPTTPALLSWSGMRYLILVLIGLGLVSTSHGEGRGDPRKQARTKTAPGIHYDLAAVNNPATTDRLEEEAEGSAVLRAQILLDRAHFSVGEIDSRMGNNTLQAIAGFRAARRLPQGTSVDPDVWKALNMDTAPVLQEYVLTGEDVSGPFDRVPNNMMLKAKLMHLGYGSALEAVGEKFHINPALLQQINPGSKFSVAGQKIYTPNVSRQENAQAARVVVSKSKSTVTVLNDAGQVMAQFPCTSGSEHDPLPNWRLEDNGRVQESEIQLQPRPILGRQPERFQSHDCARSEQPRGGSVDQPLQGALRNSRNPIARKDRTRRIARLHTSDELGCDGTRWNGRQRNSCKPCGVKASGPSST